MFNWKKYEYTIPVILYVTSCYMSDRRHWIGGLGTTPKVPSTKNAENRNGKSVSSTNYVEKFCRHNYVDSCSFWLHYTSSTNKAEICLDCCSNAIVAEFWIVCEWNVSYQPEFLDLILLILYKKS